MIEYRMCINAYGCTDLWPRLPEVQAAAIVKGLQVRSYFTARISIQCVCEIRRPTNSRSYVSLLIFGIRASRVLESCSMSEVTQSLLTVACKIYVSGESQCVMAAV